MASPVTAMTVFLPIVEDQRVRTGPLRGARPVPVRALVRVASAMDTEGREPGRHQSKT
ncbi:hypothetical protein GCM10009801_34610 [Streptomyces albiaxialis]|uniref:Uncharacterized protein n=1 Tax=Streptomyces albiaxialis TaxID=329523 RepID=A0ABN2VZF6_9ACTN